MANSSTRGTLVGVGVVCIIIGFFLSNLVCGVGVIFVILGMVMWPRGEEDGSPPPTRGTDNPPAHRPVWKPTYSAKRRRKH